MTFSSLKSAVITLLLGTLPSLQTTAQTEWLDKIDQSLFIECHNGDFRADLSGLIDLEGYYIDQIPPGLLFPKEDFFFNPRLTLFLDTQLGPHVYSLIQARVDRGFDPGAKPDGDARLDEYLLRYTPFSDSRVNVQIGKFATVVGNFVQRHDSWNNPFITAPLPYEYVTPASDKAVAGSPSAFLARRELPDNKAGWLPILWGPSYASGASLFGRIDTLEYAAEIKNAGLSSRPTVWDARDLGWEYPTLSGRIGVRPNATWNVGSSISYGAYLLPAAEPALPAGSTLGDFNQLTLGTDAGFAWRHWQVWGEAFASRFEIPHAGNADTLSYYLEAKYKWNSRWFSALRWNQQFFDRIAGAGGAFTDWDRDIWRIDTSLGYRFDRHLQAKLQYSFSRQKGTLQQGQQLVAAQLTVRF